jgi:hypothetical protein
MISLGLGDWVMIKAAFQGVFGEDREVIFDAELFRVVKSIQR